MNLLETANNVALAVVSAPETLRQVREVLREWWRIDESRKAGLARISELEIDIRKLREFNHGLAEEGDKFKARIAELESELATLHAKAGKPITRSVAEPVSLVDDEPSIPEPDPGDGFELCTCEAATEYRCAHWPSENHWRPVDKWWSPSPLLSCYYRRPYYYRRPIAKPAPQWVACTALEALQNIDTSEWMQGGYWARCRRPTPGTVPNTMVAYRTTAAMSEWVEVTREVWHSNDLNLEWCDCVEVPGKIGKLQYLVKRKLVPVGTVLG